MEINNIYFIEDKIGNIKIGVSKNPNKRKEELQIGNSSALKIVYIIENIAFSFEKHIHNICEKYRISGEWFKKEVIDHLLKNPWFEQNIKKIARF